MSYKGKIKVNFKKSKLGDGTLVHSRARRRKPLLARGRVRARYRAAGKVFRMSNLAPLDAWARVRYNARVIGLA